MCENVIKYIETLRQNTIRENRDESDQEHAGTVSDLDFSVLKDFVETAAVVFTPCSQEQKVQITNIFFLIIEFS